MILICCEGGGDGKARDVADWVGGVCIALAFGLGLAGLLERSFGMRWTVRSRHDAIVTECSDIQCTWSLPHYSYK